MLALAVAWACYCWRESPLRLPGAGKVARGSVVGLERALNILSGSIGDLLLGFVTLLLFAIGTGIYVRRFQVWLDARSSGEAVAYGSADLKDRALAANAAPKRSN